MQVQTACFKEFPDQCAGCPDYSEIINGQSSQFMWLMGAGLVYPPPYVRKIVKECKRYNKRKVEYLK